MLKIRAQYNISIIGFILYALSFYTISAMEGIQRLWPPNYHIERYSHSQLKDIEEIVNSASHFPSFEEVQENFIIPRAIIMVYKKREHVIGFIEYNPVDPPDWTLENRRGSIDLLCVHPRYSRHGYGTALLSHALADLKRQGSDKVYLAVDRTNKKALKFFKKNGFKYHQWHVDEFDTYVISLENWQEQQDCCCNIQ